MARPGRRGTPLTEAPCIAGTACCNSKCGRTPPFLLIDEASLQPAPPSQKRVLRPEGLAAEVARRLPHAAQRSATACSALQ